MATAFGEYWETNGVVLEDSQLLEGHLSSQILFTMLLEHLPSLVFACNPKQLAFLVCFQICILYFCDVILCLDGLNKMRMDI